MFSTNSVLGREWLSNMNPSDHSFTLNLLHTIQWWIFEAMTLRNLITQCRLLQKSIQSVCRPAGWASGYYRMEVIAANLNSWRHGCCIILSNICRKLRVLAFTNTTLITSGVIILAGGLLRSPRWIMNSSLMGAKTHDKLSGCDYNCNLQQLIIMLLVIDNGYNIL